MVKKELYDFDDVNEYLVGANYINQSGNISLVALWPTENGEIRILDNKLFSNEIGLKTGVNRTRNFIKSLMLGCDLYYEIKSAPETINMRKDLRYSRTIVNVDDDRLGYIEDKKYFLAYSKGNLTKEERKKLKDVKFDKEIWISTEGDNTTLSYSQEGLINPAKAYILNSKNIIDIYNAGLEDKILKDGNYGIFKQFKNSFKEISIDEYEEDTLIYYSDDIKKNSKTNLPAKRIHYFYEYNPLLESPSFGEVCELIYITQDEEGIPVWKKMPKIMQNEHDSEYLNKTLEKGIRTVVEVKDEDLDKVTRELKASNKLNRLKEFNSIPGMEDYLVEQEVLEKNNIIKR